MCNSYDLASKQKYKYPDYLHYFCYLNISVFMPPSLQVYIDLATYIEFYIERLITSGVEDITFSFHCAGLGEPSI